MAMVGRGVFGNPWLMQQCAAALAGEEIPELPPLSERCDTAVRQFELAREFGVMSIPTLVVMKDGKIVRQSTGARPKHQILEMLN